MNVHFSQCTPVKSRFRTAACVASGMAGQAPYPFSEPSFGIPRNVEHSQPGYVVPERGLKCRRHVSAVRTDSGKKLKVPGTIVPWRRYGSAVSNRGGHAMQG
jgi:hypothetical protein